MVFLTVYEVFAAYLSALLFFRRGFGGTCYSDSRYLGRNRFAKDGVSV